MQVQTLFLGPRQAGQVVGEPVQPTEFLAERGEDLRARREDAVDHPLDVPIEGGQWGAQFVGDLAEQPGAAGLGVRQGMGQGVDVGGQRGQFGLRRERDTDLVPAGGDLSGRGPHRVQRAQQPAGDQPGDDDRGGDAGQHTDDEGGVQR